MRHVYGSLPSTHRAAGWGGRCWWQRQGGEEDGASSRIQNRDSVVGHCPACCRADPLTVCLLQPSYSLEHSVTLGAGYSVREQEDKSMYRDRL